jgi:hypothetical protein
MSAEAGPTVPDRVLIEEFAKQVLADVAPEELAIFDETAEEYHQDPRGVLSASGRDESVGFGLDIALLTPYVLALSGPVLAYLLKTVGDAAKKESQPLIADWVHRLFRRGHGDEKGDEKPEPDEPEAATLSAEEAAQVREVALARAHDLKLPDDQARLLADAIVGGLNVAT